MVPTPFKQRTFLQQVLAERERCAGENKIPARILLEKKLSGLIHFMPIYIFSIISPEVPFR